MLNPKQTILMASAVSVAAVLLYSSAAAAESMPSDRSIEQRVPSTRAVAGREVIDVQEPDQFLLSELVGTTVIAQDGRAIGEVADLLLTPAGLPEALLISVGGIMGIGGKEVAVPWTRVAAFANDRNFQLLSINVRRETLEIASPFQARPVRAFDGPGVDWQAPPDVEPASGPSDGASD